MTSSHTIRLAAAVKVAQKRIRFLSTKALNQNLDWACADYADAFRAGAEEAQQEIISRLRGLAPKPEAQSDEPVSETTGKQA